MTTEDLKVGAKDALGRVLKIIRNRKVLVRSRQAQGRAVCETVGCGWTLEGKNAMGVGSQHAATKCHKVVITREIQTEYDAETPNVRA
jgi:hypothetical protein